jgi:hypothetical protein
MDDSFLASGAVEKTSGRRWSMPWLALILALALALRLAFLGAPLQQDEFGPLHAVAERSAPGPGLTPPASAPLLPVRDLAQVSRRSVLPYGIVNPLPLYHALLYLVVQVLPVAAWSLRLPSVLAGVGCVAALYVLGRRLSDPATGLAAALLAAVEPSQVALGAMARPYALANLACVLSLLALLGVLQARRHRAAALAALALGLTLAFLGYTNPVLLLAGAVHVAIVADVLLVQPLSRRERPGITAASKSVTQARSASEETQARSASEGIPSLALRACVNLSRRSDTAAMRALLCLAGVALAVLLLWPERGYLAAVSRFSQEHQDYLQCFGPPRLGFFLLQNSPLWVALGVGGVVVLLARSGQGAPEAATRSGSALTRLGWLWLLLPQAAAVLVYLLRGQSVCLSRYLSYTALGGILLLAHFAVRGRRPGLRLALPAVMAVALCLSGVSPVMRGFKQSYLLTDQSSTRHMEELSRLEADGRFQEGDVILIRSGFLEGDFLADAGATPTRPEVEAACAVPLLTVCPGPMPRPFVVLSLSATGVRTGTTLSKHFDEGRFYNRDLAERLRPHARFWLIGPDWDRRPFLACFLPWLAQSLGSSLRRSEIDGVTLIERLPPGPVSPTTTP